MTVSKSITLYWLRKWYVIMAILIIVFGIALRVHSSIMPDVMTIPTESIPSPNARDTFDAAEKLVKDKNAFNSTFTPQTWYGSKPPPGENTADIADPYHVFTLAEEDQLVAENQPAFALIRQGFSQQYMNPPSRSFSTLLPYYAQDRNMARMFSGETHDLVQHGQYGQALNCGLDDLQIGEMIPHGSLLIGRLVGLACEAIGRRRIEEDKIIDHLGSKDAMLGADRLAGIIGNEYPFVSTLQEEEWGTQGGLLEMFHKPHWQSDFINLQSPPGSQGAASQPPFAQMALSYTISPKRSFDDYTEFMNKLIVKEKLSWPAQITTPQPSNPKGDIVFNTICPDFEPSNFKWYCNLTLDQLLEVQLALRAYFVDHKTYPENLGELAPNYIPSVPIDPFSDNQPLDYKLTGSSYILYSVGPDTADDGGKPINNTGYSPNMNPRLTFEAMLNPNAKGDIVAGIND